MTTVKLKIFILAPFFFALAANAQNLREQIRTQCQNLKQCLNSKATIDGLSTYVNQITGELNSILTQSQSANQTRLGELRTEIGLYVTDCQQQTLARFQQDQRETNIIRNTQWNHGSQDCSQNTDPDLQVVEVNPGTYIIRQNKCLNYEAPFMYLMIGENGALLVDTGAGSQFPGRPDIAGKVQEILRRRQQATGKTTPYNLVVSHSHGHGDHVAGDSQFSNMPNTTVVGTSPSQISQAFGISNWPSGEGRLDLGGRTISVLPIPGHESGSVAYYDSQTRDLFTGDSLYPGNLYVQNWGQFKASAERLYNFSNRHHVRNVLGAHIEMTSTPGQIGPIGATYAPNERHLVMGKEHIRQLRDETRAMGNNPQRKALNDFVIYP